MNCDFCLISEKDSLIEISKSICTHKFCGTCFTQLKDWYDGKCPIESKNLKNITVKSINGNIRKQCQEHGRDFTMLCKVHYKLICSQCTNCNKCSTYQLESDISEALDQIIEKQSTTVSDLKLPEDRIELYEGWEDTIHEELVELERIQGILAAALNLDDLQTLKDLDQQYSNLFNKQAVEKVADDVEVIEVAMGILAQKKKKVEAGNKSQIPAGPGQGLGPGNSYNAIGSGMQGGMQGGFEGGRNHTNQEESQADERIIKIYNSLNQEGKNCLRLFYKLATYDRPIINRCFYMSQDLEDLVYLSGMAIGISPVSDFIILNSLEIYIEDNSLIQGEVFISKTSESNFIETFMFRNKIKLPRGVSCFVSITVEGEGINVFEIQIPGKVLMLDPDGHPFSLSSPILYFLIDK